MIFRTAVLHLRPDEGDLSSSSWTATSLVISNFPVRWEYIISSGTFTLVRRGYATLQTALSVFNIIDMLINYLQFYFYFQFRLLVCFQCTVLEFVLQFFHEYFCFHDFTFYPSLVFVHSICFLFHVQFIFSLIFADFNFHRY